jgi:hypothetical protein
MLIPLRRPRFCMALLFCALSSLSARAQTVRMISLVDRPDVGTAPVRTPSPGAEITIPGPLRSLLRMAGISQKVSREEVLPLLARNIYVQGYIGWRDGGRPTEFLILLTRYVNQAKELAAMAGPDGTIEIANCAAGGPLLRVLGYRLRSTCGQPAASLVTADAERAFLTIDSGFPLPTLEDALRQDKPFSYKFPQTQVPLLFTENDWKDLVKNSRRENYTLVELFLRHPLLARLYWAVSRTDAETAAALVQSVGLKKLLPVAADLDFYGSHISIRSGRVEVPGGSRAESSWKELVGASPESPAEFVPKLMAKDNGWLAAYFDSLARVNQNQQAHFVAAQRLREFYTAFRGSDSTSDAARPAFRLAPGLLLLLTRTQWDADDQPLVPGGLDLWKEILNQKSEYKLIRDWGKRATHWNRSDQLLEAMFAFSRLETDVSPLQMYLLFTELDSQRAPERRLRPATFRVLARRFEQYSDQYLVFSEFPALDDASITGFVTTADALDRIAGHTLRGNAMGTFQASVGLWQILARQRQIPPAKLNESWQGVMRAFGRVTTPAQLFDAGHNTLGALAAAATGKAHVSQDEIIELVAGPRQTDPEGRRIHDELARSIRSVLDGQRLVSLDTLLALGDGLNEAAKGAVAPSSLLPLAGELREFEMPRPIFTSSERSEWAAGIFNNRHTELQMQTDLAKVLRSSPRSQLEEARGQLSSFMRDTLVGLNYAYYEPPGAQLLHNNPLFVRSHDFSGDTVVGLERLWRAPQLFGQGSPAGGGAHFVGSLADLPYALSEAEQDFIAPENVQALIWREAVPGLLANAIFPRWWDVTRKELHGVALYQLTGEELLRSSTGSDELRAKVMAILSERMVPQRASRLEQALRAGQAEDAIFQASPADTFYLTMEFRRRFPQDKSWGNHGKELEALVNGDPAELSWERLSRDFGVPHRTLAQSYARELLNVKPFPAFAGYSSRLLAESWDSNNLYWARLADEMGLSPVMLNRLVPELTRRMVGKIFATDFEDWTALLRAMRETGEEFRQGKITVAPLTTAAASGSAVE